MAYEGECNARWGCRGAAMAHNFSDRLAALAIGGGYRTAGGRPNAKTFHGALAIAGLTHSEATVQRWFKYGDDPNKMVSIGDLRILAAFFNVSTDYLLGVPPPRQTKEQSVVVVHGLLPNNLI